MRGFATRSHSRCGAARPCTSSRPSCWARALALPPSFTIYALAHRHAHFTAQVHFSGVGLTALAAALAALALTVAGARRRDGRTVLVGTAFSAMAALLALHGIATPGILVGMNGVVAFTGGATLPVGAAVLALSALPSVRRTRNVRPLLALQVVLLSAILTLGVVGCSCRARFRACRRPEAPRPRAPGRRTGPLRAVDARALERSCSPAAGPTSWSQSASSGSPRLCPGDASHLHGARLVDRPRLRALGIFVVGVPSRSTFDATRSRARSLATSAGRSRRRGGSVPRRPVRALTLSLARKDEYTEEHTRRVALRAVQVGEELGFDRCGCGRSPPGPRPRHRQALGPRRDPPEARPADRRRVRDHQAPPGVGRQDARRPRVRGRVRHLVRDHHERLDGSGYPHGPRRR